jgi:hypothetical protein
MTAEGIVCWLTHHGYRVQAEGDSIAIVPKIDKPIIRERVLAHKPAILDYLRSLPSPPACAHAFSTLADKDAARIKELGCCIACGWPWALHGEPPESAWQRVADADSVALVEACAIVSAEVAEKLAEGEL